MACNISADQAYIPLVDDYIMDVYRRKFRRQSSDNSDIWKAEMGRVREKRRVEERRSEKRRVEERRSEKRKSQKKEDAGARKGRKVAKHSVSPIICGSGGSKSRLAQAAGAEPDERWKIARRGAKHISKSKCTKHTSSGPLLEVEMSKKCTPLWREAHFEVKMYKTHQLRTTFGSWDVEKVHAVVARSTFRSQNVHHMFAPLLEVQMSFRVAGARDCASSQKWAKREGFVSLPQTMAGVGHLKRICKDAFAWQAQYVRHLHQSC